MIWVLHFIICLFLIATRLYSVVNVQIFFLRTWVLKTQIV